MARFFSNPTFAKIRKQGPKKKFLGVNFLNFSRFLFRIILNFNRLLIRTKRGVYLAKI